MHKTLPEIVYSIKEALSGYHITDDNIYSDEFIIAKIDDIRGTLIREAYRNRRLDDKYYQFVDCIEVKCMNKSCDVGGITVVSNEIIYYAEIPPLIAGVAWEDIRYLGMAGINIDTENAEVEFARVSMQGFLYHKYREWTYKMRIYTLADGNKIFFRNAPEGLQRLSMLALLAKPITACNYFMDKTIYPVPENYKLELLVKQDILATYGIVPDMMQDTRPIEHAVTQKETPQQLEQVTQSAMREGMT